MKTKYGTILFCIVHAEDIKKLLFNLSKQEMKEVFDRYSARTPEPLTTQFSSRIDRETGLNFSQQVPYLRVYKSSPKYGARKYVFLLSV